MSLESRWITCKVPEWQLRLEVHVVSFPEVDPAHRVFSAKDNLERRRPRGRPRIPWLRQVGGISEGILGMRTGLIGDFAGGTPRDDVGV